MSVEIITQFRALPGGSTELIARVTQLLLQPLYQDGCEQTRLRQNQDDPDEILLLQRFGSRRQFEDYRDGRDMAGALRSLLSAPLQVRCFDEVPTAATVSPRSTATETQDSKRPPSTRQVPKVSTPDALGG